MEESKNQLPAQLHLPPHQVTKPIIQALFNTELVRRNYRKILQAAAIRPTKENIKDAYSRLKDLEGFAKEMENYRKSVSDPYFKIQKDIKGTFDEMMLPILTEIETLKSAIKIVNDELSANLERAQAEAKRVQAIQNGMINFINWATIEIGNAKDEKQLGIIQMRIGSEKARKNFYQEFTEDFGKKCDSLTPLTNQRKQTIKRGNTILKQMQETNDPEQMAALREELELLDLGMEENILRIQETAFEQAAATEVVVGEPMIEKIKGRNFWKWKVDDLAALYKKHPHLVILSPNKEAIDQLLAEKKKEFIEKGANEYIVNGVVFYLENKL